MKWSGIYDISSWHKENLDDKRTSSLRHQFMVNDPHRGSINGAYASHVPWRTDFLEGIKSRLQNPPSLKMESFQSLHHSNWGNLGASSVLRLPKRLPYLVSPGRTTALVGSILDWPLIVGRHRTGYALGLESRKRISYCRGRPRECCSTSQKRCSAQS